MPEQACFLPDRFVLNGTDYFLLQLDRIMSRSSGKYNVCTFVVTLEDRLELEQLERYLSDIPAYLWVTRLRFRKGIPFSLPEWVVNKKATSPIIKQHSLAEMQQIQEYFIASAIKVKTQSPFKIDLIQLKHAGSVLVFTWHHSLMDAHGGESFVRHLGLNHTSTKPQWLKPYRSDLPLRQRAQIALETKDFLFEVSQLPLLSLFRKQSAKPKLSYQVQTFTEKQSQLINKSARQQGAGFLLSAFYLATTACAVAKIQKQRVAQNECGNEDIMIPIPLDMRRKGSDEPIIGNQVSFLFYRIPKQDLLDLNICTAELIEQMKNLMRADSPNRCMIMMDFMRRVPEPIYRLLVKQPTKGLMASFFFSDTGKSLLNNGKLFESSIINSVHYPPTMYPPGITFVFSQFRGCLQITLGYMRHVISEQEVEQLFKQLRTSLLSEGTT